MKQVISLKPISYISPLNEIFCFYFDLEKHLENCGYDTAAFITAMMANSNQGKDKGSAFHPTAAITFEKVLCYRLSDIKAVLDYLCWEYTNEGNIIDINNLKLIDESGN